MTLASGSQLGHYQVLTSLGAGGTGEVYRTRDTPLKRTVAVKVLPVRLSSSPEVRQVHQDGAIFTVILVTI